MGSTCAATPADLWKQAHTAVAGKNVAPVVQLMTPAFRAANAIEGAVGASMIIEMSSMSAEMSGDAAKQTKAAAEEKKLLAELDALLTKHKAMTIKQIGTPLLPRMEAPEVVAAFSKIDHVAFLSDLEPFFRKVATAAEAGGMKSEKEGFSLDELLTGSGKLSPTLAGVSIKGETATARSFNVTMKFKKTGNCWLIDGRE